MTSYIFHNKEGKVHNKNLNDTENKRSFTLLLSDSLDPKSNYNLTKCERGFPQKSELDLHKLD